MKQIEFERWKPDAENPRRLTYAGQRTAEDVFHELEARLDSVGYLPDEYLLLDRRWQNGREMPRDAGFFCRTDYGGSEGIYLDMFLEWYEDSQRRTEHFMTGKTLGESGALPCVVQITLTGENAAYSRLYLHNTASEKWQFLNSYKDGTITADMAGSYLLTNQNLRFTNINWTFFIAAGALTVVCLIVYIAVKKRYWFW